MRRPRSHPTTLQDRARAHSIAHKIVERLMDDAEGRRIRHEMRVMTDPDYFMQVHGAEIKRRNAALAS